MTFGRGGVPETSRPGIHPESLDDFRREPATRGSMLGVSSEEVYARWLERTKYVAERAKSDVEASGRSATALARLAHAYLAADEPYLAAPAATEALDSLISPALDASAKLQTAVPADVPAAVSAAWALILAGHSNLAEERLAQLSSSVPVLLIRATIAVDTGRLLDALELLRDVDSPGVASLRGYVFFRLNRPQEAIRELRKAISSDVRNADACVTLAAAFWQLGSRRKAITLAKRAAQIAPGRKDTTLALIDYLTDSYELAAAEAEIRAIHQSGVDDEPDLVLRGGWIRALSGDLDRTTALLRRAWGMARASKDSGLTAFTEGQLTLLNISAVRSTAVKRSAAFAS